MDHLRRSLAPLSDSAWDAIEREAGRTLKHFLAGRALIDFAGPKGWDYSSRSTGRVRAAAPSPIEGVVAGVRESQPVLELRVPFELAMLEMDNIDRGAENPDLQSVIDAARTAALAEDHAIFNGFEPAGMEGIGHASPHPTMDIGDDYDHYPSVVARAVAALRRAGIGGPYAIALGSRCYTGVVETTEHGGYPVLEHLKLILGGPVVWAPAVDGAVVVSKRGGDYEFISGEDFSIGYRTQVMDTIELYIEESFTLNIIEPAAAIALRHRS